MAFMDYFSSENLVEYFYKNLIQRDGGGRDKMVPKVFWEKYQNDIHLISNKCISGAYHFAAYNEKLVLKGRDKLPRVISIPTIRDRLVLGVLNKYLQDVFPECVCHDVPNKYISDISHFVSNHQNNVIRFLKIDLKSFFDSINHTRLIFLLKERINDDIPLKLIQNAIETPTLSVGTLSNDSLKNRKGVPQGLAISNILTNIYMKGFDEHFNSMEFYKRYVDDILFLQTQYQISQKTVKRYIQNEQLKLKLAKEKTVKGVLGQNQLDYLGYIFKGEKISIRPKKIEQFICKLAGICTKFKKEFNDEQRMIFRGDDEAYINYFINELNMYISGIKFNTHCYGWLPCYRSITDLSLLFRLDKILRNRLMKGFPPKNEISKVHRFVESYYELKNPGGGRLIFDFNKLNSISERQSFLIEMNVLRSDVHYEEKEINNIFEKYVHRKIKLFEENIGYI